VSVFRRSASAESSRSATFLETRTPSNATLTRIGYSHSDLFVKEKALSRTVSAAEAKARFSDCVRRAEGGDPVVITRHGKPVAALVPASALNQLRGLHSAGPEAGLAGVAGGWKGSDELVRALARSRRTGSRQVPNLDA